MPTLAELLRNDPWGAPPSTPLAKTVNNAGFDPSLGLAGAIQTYLARLKRMQAGPAQDMLDTAADPNAEGIQRAANLLGGLGLKIANVPMALMPSSQELRDRGYQAGASPEVQALGGALGDAVNIPDPATVGPALATLVKAGATAKALAAGAAPLLKSAAVAPLGKGLASLLADASPAEQAALKARLEAEAAQTGGQASSVSREQALNGLTGNDGIIAYHGSPHSFDKFDMSKIGTGEGNQAFLRGLYFAGDENLAKYYRDKISSYVNGLPENITSKWPSWNGDFSNVVLSPKRTDGAASRSYTNPDDFVRDLALTPDIINDPAVPHEFKKAMEGYKPSGSVYQVKIDAHPNELIDWDKPMGQQSEQVRSRLKSAGVPDWVLGDKMNAGFWLKRVEGSKYVAADFFQGGTGELQLSPSELADRLKNAGVKGIQFKDARSRGSDGGTNNYVVFDDKLITILKKYGVPMTAGAGGAMLVAGQNMPPDIAAQLQQQ